MIEVVKITGSNIHILTLDFLQLITNDGDREQAVSLAHLGELANDSSTYLFVAILDGKIEGYALAYRFPSLRSADNLAYLYDIEVSPAHYREGIGRMLIHTVLEYLKKDKVRELWLGTATDNREAQALFASTGAEKSEETFHDYTYYLGD